MLTLAEIVTPETSLNMSMGGFLEKLREVLDRERTKLIKGIEKLVS